MKNIIKTSGIVWLCVVLFSGCTKTLEEIPKSFVNKTQFFENEEQCIAALNGCYNDISSIFTHNLFRAIEGSTDLAFLQTDDIDASFAISPANPGAGRIIWQNAYHGVMVANATIEGIKKSPVDEEKKNEFIAEAVTLRALYYYVLTSMFGDVPFYTDEVADFDTLEMVANLSRMDAEATRKSLIDELNQYVSFLPQMKTSNVPGNRVSAPMAYMLIAKMYMWNKQFEQAIPALEEIKNIYGNINDYPLEDVLFRHKNTAESIFEAQFSWSPTGLKKTTLVAALCLPPRKAETDVYDGVSIPELGDKANPSTSIKPSDHLINLYLEDENDLREDLVLAREYNGEWFNRPKTDNFQGKPWMGPKFWFPQMDNKQDGNNQKVFRYADALLMIAECYNETDHREEALKHLNMVRMRANTFPIEESLNKEELFEEIKNERARELMGEYGRKWDLVRWGVFYDVIKETIAKENDKVEANLRPYHEYYPIPDDEVFKSKGKLTNDAYNEK